jgi:hypothetical protein
MFVVESSCVCWSWFVLRTTTCHSVCEQAQVRQSAQACQRLRALAPMLEAQYKAALTARSEAARAEQDRRQTLNDGFQEMISEMTVKIEVKHVHIFIRMNCTAVVSYQRHTCSKRSTIRVRYNDRRLLAALLLPNCGALHYMYHGSLLLYRQQTKLGARA